MSDEKIAPPPIKNPKKFVYFRCVRRAETKMVSFSCESCQDTIKKPKLEAVYTSLLSIIDDSMPLDVMDRLPVSIVIQPFMDGIGTVMSNVSLRSRSIKRVIRKYVVNLQSLMIGKGSENGCSATKSEGSANRKTGTSRS